MLNSEECIIGSNAGYANQTSRDETPILHHYYNNLTGTNDLLVL
jgi:hypothetical protein